MNRQTINTTTHRAGSTFITTALLAPLFLASAFSHASTVLQPLESRLGGEAYYDPNLDITWAANAGMTGAGTLSAAINQADTLDIGGITHWRITRMDRNNDGQVAECRNDTLDACADNELGFMLHKRNVWSGAPGPFTNVAHAWYWSTDDDPNWVPRVFAMDMGAQNQDTRGNAHPDNTGLWGWAVIDGDVATMSTVVPIPAAIWLFGSGLLGLIGISTRSNRV